MSVSYSVVMTGKIAAGLDMADVKMSVGQLLKLNPDQVEKLFSGKAVILKRGLDKPQAMKIRNALAKAGALAAIKEEQAPAAEEVAEVEAQPAPATDAADGSPAQTTTNNDTGSIVCPRCGHEQPFATSCSHCKMDLQLHILRLEKRAKARANRR